MIQTTQNTGASSRTAVLTFSMTDYPGTYCTATITQTAQAATVTYALVLGAASYTIGAGGGSYTLTAQGVTYTNGVETSRVTLSASDIDFAKSGSSAISRSGLVFSGADLGTAMTMEQTAYYTLTWRANGASANFTCKQQANSRTPSGAPTETLDFSSIPNPIIWHNSGTSTASKAGDYVRLVPTVNITTTQAYVYTSGATATDTLHTTDGGTVTVGGGGLSVTGTPSLYEITWEANPDDSSRIGAIMVAYGGDSVSRSVTQAAGDSPSPAPSQITIHYDDGGIIKTATSVGRYLYTNYTAWRFSGIQGMWYTRVTPSVGDGIYSDTALTVQVGEIVAVTY